MPAVWRQIGEPFLNNKGIMTKPKVLITWCRDCGFEGASFGAGGEWFCGWREGAAICVGKGRK